MLKKKKFILDAETIEDGLDESSVAEIERAVSSFVETDVTLKLECIFVDEDTIRSLNREQRSIDKVTDVLSFPQLDGIKGRKIYKRNHPYDLDEDGTLILGSIALCIARAKEQAAEYGHSYRRELHYLIVHGVLHCLGYDHMTDEEKAEMREKEEEILGKMGITRGA